MERKKLNFINVMPVFLDNPAYSVSEIRRQHRELGLCRFALSLSFHPVGMPAKNNADTIVAKGRYVMEALRDEPVEVGVLIQSTLGHGWSGPVPLTEEPWSRIVKVDGVTSSRMCISDHDFQNYVLYAVGEVMKLKPAFLIMDDDFGLRKGECFCDNCIRQFNEEAAALYGSKPRSREEVIKMVQECPEDDKEVLILARQRHRMLIDFAHSIRAVIDQYNPEIVVTQCTSGGAHGWISELAHALAGSKAHASARVNNATYLLNQPLHFYTLSSQTHMIKYQYENIPDVIAESDTFPHILYSESARTFNTHIIHAILCGLNGAKLWMADYGEQDNTTAAPYEATFRQHRFMYEELFNTLSDVKWCGVNHLLTHGSYASMTHPLNASWPSYAPDWIKNVIGPFAIPYAYGDGSGDGIYALCESNVRFLTDEQIEKLFSKNLLIDSKAAKMLDARGFSRYMGVRTVQDDMFFFEKEYVDESNPDGAVLMWEDAAAKLECLSDKTEIKTWCTVFKNGKSEKVAPCMTYFTNERGGRVVTLAWSPDFTIHCILRKQRKRSLQMAFEFLNGGKPLDMVVDGWQQVMVRHGVIQGGSAEIVALIALSLDTVPSVRMSLSRQPKQLLALQDDGTWREQAFQWEAGQITVNCPLNVCEPVILKITC